MFCSLQKGRYQAIIADPYQLTLKACIVDLNDPQTSSVPTSSTTQFNAIFTYWQRTDLLQNDMLSSPSFLQNHRP